MINLLVAVSAFVCLDGAEPLAGQTMRLTLQTEHYGPLEAIVEFSERSSNIVGVSSSAAAARVRAMVVDEEARDWDGRALLTLSLVRHVDGLYEGRALSPYGTSEVSLRFADGELSGRIASGPLAGDIRGVAHPPGQAPLRDYPAVLAGIDQMLPGAIFDPNVIAGEPYNLYRRGLGEVALLARDDLEFVLASDLGWNGSIFSHFAVTRRSASEIAAAADAADAVSTELRFDEDIAILRVNTFLGEDAIAEIESAIEELVERDAGALIVDLRGTPGGSLAAKTLIEGVISEPMEMGWFTANAWWRAHGAAPMAEDVASRPASDLSDPGAAFGSLMNEGLLRVRLRPGARAYAGPVFVLIDADTASVAELAAAVLGGSGRAVLIRERTAGALLTADTLPLPEGFALMTPLADYSDARLGRIEGVGVAPHVASDAAEAMSHALRRARRALRGR